MKKKKRRVIYTRLLIKLSLFTNKAATNKLAHKHARLCRVIGKGIFVFEDTFSLIAYLLSFLLCLNKLVLVHVCKGI